MMRLAQADVSICVMSLAEIATPGGAVRVPERVQHLLGPNTHVLLNKLDLCGQGQINNVRSAFSQCAGVWPMSLNTLQGASEFVKGLEGDLVKRCVCYNAILLSLGELMPALFARFGLSGEAEAPLITTTRHRAHLEDARAFLEAFLDTGLPRLRSFPSSVQS
jgi:hypothetical protein